MLGTRYLFPSIRTLSSHPVLGVGNSAPVDTSVCGPSQISVVQQLRVRPQKTRKLSTNSSVFASAFQASDQQQGEVAGGKVPPVPEADREPLAADASPQEVFDHRVKYNDLSYDSHQAEVTSYFQSLYDQLTIYKPATPSLLSRLFSGSRSGQDEIPTGVYLWGTVGGGKTMLMDLFFDTLPGLDPDIKCRRVHYHDFMQDVHRRMHEAKKSAPPRDMSRWDTYQPFDPVPLVGDTIIAENWVICLDEFQVTDIADAMILKQLFAYLFDKGLIVVATSNRPPKDLYKNGIQRSNFLPFLDMLVEKCHTVSLDPGVDYRRKNLAGADKLFFNLSDPEQEANANLDMIFKFMAAKETDSVREISIRIKGRDVHFNKACGGVLDCDFTEMCGRPLWTNDYLKITQVFHTVLIRNIPVLSQKNKSEARRFITLIDTLYDHKIRVVCSGEVDYWELFQSEEISHQDRLNESRLLIDDLGLKAAAQGSLDSGVFSGEEELFAFDRTVSRLTEMQTKDYWKKWKSYVENR